MYLYGIVLKLRRRRRYVRKESSLDWTLSYALLLLFWREVFLW
jgi:hypothetical protein